jgi:hypothetical protein
VVHTVVGALRERTLHSRRVIGPGVLLLLLSTLLLGMLSATINVANSTQNYPKLPKFAIIYPKPKL